MSILTIIVTYNGSGYIRECLRSLRQADAAGQLHTLVIDNQSSDNTCEIVEQEFPEVELIQTGQNLGFGKANNIGMKLALERKADFIFLLNQDAYVQADTLTALTEACRKHPEYGILSPMQLNGDGSALDYTFNPYCVAHVPDLVSDLCVKPSALQEVYSVYFTNAAAWFMPLEFLQTVGGFAPVYPHYGEDNDYINRCHFHGYKVGVCPGISVRHDRPQAAKSVQDSPLSKLAQMAYIRSLIILTDINTPLGRAYGKSLLRTLRELLFGFRFKVLAAEIKGAFLLAKAAGQVTKSRAVSKVRGPSFISE